MPYAVIHRAKLYYERHGSGPAVVLIHGLGSSARDWSPQLEALARDHTVLVMDLRGHGRSEDFGDTPASVAGFAADLAELLDHQSLSEADIVGLSLGGAVAFQFARSYPTKTRSLVIVNSSPSFIPKTWRLRGMLWQRLLLIRLMGMTAMARVLARKLFPADIALQRLFIERFGQNRKRSYLQTLKALTCWSVESELCQITCPTLVIGADNDYTSNAAKKAYVAQMPNAWLSIIPNSHHALPMERPDQFNLEVQRFLAASIPSPTSATASPSSIAPAGASAG